MVTCGGLSNIGWQLNSRKRISGFGMRRRRTTGRGIVRKVIGSVSRPVLGFLANRIADAISGGRIHRRRVHHHRRIGGSYKVTGTGRRPRRTLTRRPRRGGSYKVTGTGRRPRRTLGIRRHRRY